MKNKYDLTLVLKTEFSGEAKDKFVEKVEKMVKTLGGSVDKTIDMGKKQLAYRIAKQSEGQYVNMMLEMPGNVVVELQKKLTVDRDVLRHLLLVAEPAAPKTRKTTK